jgi:hypothetical protein
MFISLSTNADDLISVISGFRIYQGFIEDPILLKRGRGLYVREAVFRAMRMMVIEGIEEYIVYFPHCWDNTHPCHDSVIYDELGCLRMYITALLVQGNDFIYEFDLQEDLEYKQFRLTLRIIDRYI